MNEEDISNLTTVLALRLDDKYYIGKFDEDKNFSHITREELTVVLFKIISEYTTINVVDLP